jgi:hypothetical protein
MSAGLKELILLYREISVLIHCKKSKNNRNMITNNKSDIKW